MIALKLKNVSKCFNTPKRNKGLIKTLLSQVIPNDENKPWALKNVSFDVEKGECIGIIGDNGSGKSTLLKIIAKITTPSEGSVQINGRTGSFLELGIGFQGELSGEENIFLYGSLLGIRKDDIKKNYKRMIEFSELKEAIHHPIKTYSSGMLARLAFSVLAFTDPDILLLDEVSSVGDHSFKQKSLNKLLEFKRKGKTILIVSHNISELLKICDKCVLLEEGRLNLFDDARSVTEAYISKTNQKNKLNLLSQINKEESNGYDTSKLFYLYNELDMILENTITLSRESITRSTSEGYTKNMYNALVKQCEERSEVLRKMLECYKKENQKPGCLLTVYQNLLGVLGNLQDIYEGYFHNREFYNKRIENYKEQIVLIKEIIRLYSQQHNSHKLIKYYEKLMYIMLRYSDTNEVERKPVLLNIKQILKEGLKRNKNSEDLLKCIIRVTKELTNISTGKEKKTLLTEIKDYNQQYNKALKEYFLKSLTIP